MATAQIGALRVSLGLDTAQFSSGLKGVSGKVNGFVIGATAGLAAVAGAAVMAFNKIRGAADRADEAWKTSQSIGIPIKDLGRLQFAAEMSGASIETLSTGVRKAQQAFAKAASGGVSDATKMLKEMGIGVKDARNEIRPTIDIIGDIAEEFSKAPDGAAKTNAAMAIFGKTGAALIPTLNMGRKGLKDMGDEAERLGLVFDEKTARSSEQFNDNLMRLGLTMTGLWNKVLAQVIPGFALLSDRIVAATQSGGVLDGVARGIGTAMNLAARGVALAIDNLDFLIDLFKIFVGAKIIGFLFGATKAFIAMAKTIRLAALATALLTSLTRIKITALALLAALIAKVTGLYDPFIQKLGELGQAVANALPPELRQTFDELGGGILKLGDYITGVGNDVGITEDELAGLGDTASLSFGEASKGATDVGDAVDFTTGKIATMGDILREVAGTISSGLSGVVKDAIKGGDAIGNLIGKVGDLGDRLIDMAFDQAISGFLQMVVGTLTGSAVGFSYGPGVISDPWAGMRMPGLATGGRTLTSGLVEVGERGRELLNLPAGASVIRHNDVSEMTRDGGDGGPNITISITGSRQDATEIAREVRRVLPDAMQSYNRNPLRRP